MIRDFSTSNAPALHATALAWLSGEHGEPAPLRPAATVMIVRDASDDESGNSGGSPVEVFLLRRVASMAFAPSTIVFPGGGVDPRDSAELPWAGPGVLEWSVRLGADEEATRKLVVAAVREVFEECGVLFASADEDGPLVEVSSPQWQQVRAGLVARELSLSDVLREHGLCLRTDLLRAHAHWVTPVCEPRRFDTRFFVAVAPEGQVASHDDRELVSCEWLRPRDAVAADDAGEIELILPTRRLIEFLDRFATTAEVMRFARVHAAASAPGPVAMHR